MKRLSIILLTATVAFGSAVAASATASAAPMQPSLTVNSSNVVQVRSDDYRSTWDQRDRYYDRRHWRRDDDRRYWHRERWREREWRRHHNWRERRGPAIILDF